MTLAALEAALARLYAGAGLTEAARAYRAELAHEYRARTGEWFAARYYLAGRRA